MGTRLEGGLDASEGDFPPVPFWFTAEIFHFGAVAPSHRFIRGWRAHPVRRSGAPNVAFEKMAPEQAKSGDPEAEQQQTVVDHVAVYSTPGKDVDLEATTKTARLV